MPFFHKFVKKPSEFIHTDHKSDIRNLVGRKTRREWLKIYNSNSRFQSARMAFSGARVKMWFIRFFSDPRSLLRPFCVCEMIGKSVRFPQPFDARFVKALLHRRATFMGCQCWKSLCYFELTTWTNGMIRPFNGIIQTEVWAFKKLRKF